MTVCVDVLLKDDQVSCLVIDATGGFAVSRIHEILVSRLSHAQFTNNDLKRIMDRLYIQRVCCVSQFLAAIHSLESYLSTIPSVTLQYC